MKPYVVLGGAVAVVLIGVVLGISVSRDTEIGTDTGSLRGVEGYPDRGEEQVDETSSEEKIKADVFSGTLEQVDTGCFADGECFVTVDGKHVTAIMGWSQETVGAVQGVEGFGDLESHIGEAVEVYAQVKEDGSYTLYGSEGFYIKLIGAEEEKKDTEEGVGQTGEQKPQVTNDGCVVGGCSSQLCVDATEATGMVSTCEYRAEYACYQTAICRRASNGQCGWVETKELFACLVEKAEEPLEVVQ